jgi:ERCC4-related helicase
MFIHCESAQISTKDINVNKNIKVTIPFVQLPNDVCFQTIKMMQILIQFKAALESIQIHSLSSLVYFN